MMMPRKKDPSLLFEETSPSPRYHSAWQYVHSKHWFSKARHQVRRDRLHYPISLRTANWPYFLFLTEPYTAVDENRTRDTSLGSWSFTTKLRPQINGYKYITRATFCKGYQRRLFLWIWWEKILKMSTGNFLVNVSHRAIILVKKEWSRWQKRDVTIISWRATRKPKQVITLVFQIFLTLRQSGQHTKRPFIIRAYTLSDIPDTVSSNVFYSLVSVTPDFDPHKMETHFTLPQTPPADIRQKAAKLAGLVTPNDNLAL